MVTRYRKWAGYWHGGALMISPTTILQDLATCLCDNIHQTTGVGLCWCGVYPGGVPAWDHCTDCDSDMCGMGFVTVTGATRYTSFGQALQTPTKCDAMTQLGVSMGVLRCFPMEEDGSAPSADALTEVAAQLALDMEAIRFAAVCCYKGDVILNSYEPIPPTGGCIGGQWLLTVDAW